MTSKVYIVPSYTSKTGEDLVLKDRMDAQRSLKVDTPRSYFFIIERDEKEQSSFFDTFFKKRRIDDLETEIKRNMPTLVRGKFEDNLDSFTNYMGFKLTVFSPLPVREIIDVD